LENYQLGRLQRKIMITLTDSAVVKLQDLLAEENNPKLKLRVFVQGGGCSGFQYGFTLDDATNEDDFDIQINGVPVLVDGMSSQYLQGAMVDYREDNYGASFVINNPQAVSTCGCGSSFSV
jgi:iron-sulfur cluster insertion protein